MRGKSTKRSAGVGVRVGVGVDADVNIGVGVGVDVEIGVGIGVGCSTTRSGFFTKATYPPIPRMRTAKAIIPMTKLFVNPFGDIIFDQGYFINVRPKSKVFIYFYF
jgi:hypothetical protein